MTWYADLSPYSYLPDALPEGIIVLNVGWLGAGHDFEQGEAPDGFTDALATVCACQAEAKTRGWHHCELPHPGGPIEYPVSLRAGGNVVPLGNAEVRLAAEDGRWLAAPNLIYHYVTDHHYLPPRVFIEAVMALRVASIDSK